MDDYTRLLNKMLEDPEFKKEWDVLEPEFQEIRGKILADIGSITTTSIQLH